MEVFNQTGRLGSGLKESKSRTKASWFNQLQGRCGRQRFMQEEKEPSPSSSDRDEDVIREHSFKRATGLNLDAFMLTNETEDTPPSSSSPPLEEASKDAAIGEMGELFTTASIEPETNTSPASATEQHIGRGLAVAMVLVWTSIGALVGTVLPPVIGAVGLFGMALFGFFLTERWIRRDAMHLLGLTWAIISMKLLYGLALDLWRWGWLDGLGPSANESLGVLMLLLVGLNVGLAFRHDEDAIAAQSALVLFAIGSSAGAVFGEGGVAVFIVLAMVLMHGLALARSSGNLASLGISMSYLWVGVHALSDNWTVGSLNLVPIENGLTLFVLLSVVTGANAAMAARFVHHENWLSQAVHAIGLGKPGLWAVSVSLGMVGALMAIGAHRSETGYALAQLMLLTLAFSASYLVVRGVPWKSLMPFVLAPLPFMIAGLALVNTGAVAVGFPFAMSEYALFALLSAALCATILLLHQSNVSDHVLWLGSLVVVVLLTILIPADVDDGQARLLLVSQGLVWLGLGALAVLRSSPSMAGVAVLAPFGWLLVFATDFETRLINADLVPVVLSEHDVGWWMLALVGQQVLVCMRMGGAQLNLGAAWIGRSEISSRIRDAEVLNLWSLGFLAASATYLSMTRPEGLTAPGVLLGMGALLLSHAVMVWRGRHQGRPQTMFVAWSVVALAVAWRYGDEAAWATLLTGGSLLLMLGALQAMASAEEDNKVQAHHRALPGRLLTLHLMVVSALFLVVALGPQRATSLTGQGLVSMEVNLWILTAMGAISLLIYIARLSVLDALLLPSVGAVGVVLSMALAGQTAQVDEVPTVALGLFVLVGAYLAFQGDVRSGIRALAAKEERLAAFEEKRERVNQLMESGSQDGPTSVRLKALDAELLQLAERQKKRAKRADVGGVDDLLVGDIHYRPVVLLLFLLVAFLVAAWMAYATPFGLHALVFSGGFAVLLVGLTRLRANAIGLRLPDVFGVELPILLAMGGVVLVHVAGRMTTGVLSDDAFHQVVLMASLVVLGGMGLSGRNDLGLRIPSALEAVLAWLIVDRLICLFLGGEVPVPWATDPLEASLVEWGLPLLVMEVFLLGMVLLYDWVEGERLKRGLNDHRTAAGRSTWMMGTAILSLGLAGVVALLAGIRRGRSWQQPAVALTAVVLVPFTVQALTVWALASVASWLTPTNVTAFVGLSSVIWAAVVVRSNHLLWLSAALWACHFMLYPAAILHASLVSISLASMTVSATAWLSGILTRNKSWRVVGALDLLIAWLFALVAVIGGASSSYVLMLLVASALLLFAVTTLTQANETALLDD
jgi:hypothetical protein